MTDPLLVDLYAGDGRKDWRAFCAAGAPWTGVILKATQGTYYRPPWFPEERRAFVLEAGARHGDTLFDGAYHYLDFAIDGGLQADYFWRAVEDAGGERAGTLWAMLDVERGGQRNRNPSRTLVEDRVRTFADRYHVLSGRLPTLYGGELLRALGVADRMGCGRSAVALYGSELHGRGESTAQFLARTGTDLAHAMLWQYVAAEGEASGPASYPRTAPGCGRVDISALVLPGGIATLKSTLWAERP